MEKCPSILPEYVEKYSLYQEDKLYRLPFPGNQEFDLKRRILRSGKVTFKEVKRDFLTGRRLSEKYLAEYKGGLYKFMTQNSLI